MKSAKAVVSPWLFLAVLAFGLMLVFFVFVEYQRNTELLEQNEALISGSTKARLTNDLLNERSSKNWATGRLEYRWIQHPPRTYWFNDGEQQFPWSRLSPGSVPKGKWQSVWSAVDSLKPSGTVNPQRLALLLAVKDALRSNEKSAIRQSFDAYVEHKNAFYLSPYEEIAFSVKLVEIGAKRHWSSELVHAILITGGPSEEPIFRPVVDWLFRHAELFSKQEVLLIVSKIRQHLEALNLSSYHLDDYLEHLESPQFSLPPDIDVTEAGSGVIVNRRWLVRRVSQNHVRAEPIKLNEKLQTVKNEFVALGVLALGDTLSLTGVTDRLELKDIDVDVHKQQLTREQVNQGWYLTIKIMMLLAFISLVMWTLRLVEKSQERRLEYISLKEDFVKLVSHELKTPLAGIRAMAETLRKRLQRNMDVQRYPERIVGEADKLWYMVDNILGFNRVQLAEVAIDKQHAKLQPLCDKIVDEVRSFSSKPYIVKNAIDAAVDEQVDIELFSLVVKNLMVNAGLYNENSIVEIELAYDTKSRCMSLSDNGIGVAQEDRDKLFKPFVRLSQSVRKSGTGLGLALCQRIMHLHDGGLALRDSTKAGSVWQISFKN